MVKKKFCRRQIICWTSFWWTGPIRLTVVRQQSTLMVPGGESPILLGKQLELEQGRRKVRNIKDNQFLPPRAPRGALPHTLRNYVLHSKPNTHCELVVILLSLLIFVLSSPREARAFHKLSRYHTRPLRLNCGPKNVHFRKTQFWDPNINDRILNLKKYKAQLFNVLSFPLGYLKTAQKTVQSSKNAEK